MRDELPILSRRECLDRLPPVWPEDLQPAIRAAVAAQPSHKIVVLDDDPTGTQTVHGVPVLTDLEPESLRAELGAPQPPCFFILTNSRSLAPDDARALNSRIAHCLAQFASRCSIVSRSDSTLRGHFPLETDVWAGILGPFDATILIPYFEAGGRYTIGDVHYVAHQDALVPAAQTPFARDPAFGFRHSNLRMWIEEKTRGRVRADAVGSIALDDLRQGGPAAVTARLLAFPAGSYAIVNAAAPRDLDVFVAGLLEAERAGRRYLFRTAAQFVAARIGQSPRPLLTARDLPLSRGGGGLIVAGSFVPQTTAQLAQLRSAPDLEFVELDVPALLAAAGGPCLREIRARIDSWVASGRDVAVATSRELVAGSDPAASLAIGARVSAALVDLVRHLDSRPGWMAAKGGITSSDIATRALGVRRALVEGQILPGVPVWRLGPESRWPDLPYVVFPGNVGGPDALARVLATLRARKAMGSHLNI